MARHQPSPAIAESSKPKSLMRKGKGRHEATGELKATGVDRAFLRVEAKVRAMQAHSEEMEVEMDEMMQELESLREMVGA